MNESTSVYLQEEEVEHVIRTLSSHTSARDLAEAIGRSEEEVIHALQTVRASKPADETSALRAENEELKRRIEALESKPTVRRFFVARGVVLAIVASVFLMALGVMTLVGGMARMDSRAPQPVTATSYEIPANVGSATTDSAAAPTQAND